MKLGNAVKRNRVRRRIRELYRTNEHRFSSGYDIVVVARTRAIFARYSELERSFLRLMKSWSCWPRRRGSDEGRAVGTDPVLSAGHFPPAPPLLPLYSHLLQYALEAVEKYGAVKGGWLAVRRLLRCHPFHRQKSVEYDPVP